MNQIKRNFEERIAYSGDVPCNNIGHYAKGIDRGIGCALNLLSIKISDG